MFYVRMENVLIPRMVNSDASVTKVLKLLKSQMETDVKVIQHKSHLIITNPLLISWKVLLLHSFRGIPWASNNSILSGDANFFHKFKEN